MRIKNIFILILFALFISACSVNQIEKNIVVEVKKKVVLEREAISDELLSDINHILFLLKQKDLETLNSRFINPPYGLYEVLKDNQNNKFIFNKKLQIDEISDEIDSFEIKKEEVIFNCSPYDDKYYGWNKEGVFISTNIQPYLSNIMKEANLLKINTYSEEEIKIANNIEKTSYEVVIPYNIVFYITKIDKQWYITLVDKVKTDCTN
ncbi:hypothetical protein KKG81_04425 [bacterium]|nr:hypothetical protein [bacterium]